MTRIRQCEIYIDRTEKNYKIIIMEDHNQEKRKKNDPRTDNTNTQIQKKASTEPTATKRDRSLLDQRKSKVDGKLIKLVPIDLSVKCLQIKLDPSNAIN